MKRPLLMVALLYAGGIVLADNLSLPLGAVLPAAMAVGIAALVLGRALVWLLGLLLFLTGASNLTFRAASIAPNDLQHLVREDASIVILRGRLVDTPYHRVYDSSHGQEPTQRTLAEIRVDSLQLANGPRQAAAGNVMVSTPGLLPAEFFGGKYVELEGVLKKPQPPVAPGQFDYRNYLRRHGVHFQLQVASTNDWRVAASVAQPARPPLADRFIGWAQGILARGIPEDESMHLLWAMTLGWKTALTGEVSEPFMRSGTMHVFAISGLHIALIAGILVLVFRAARVPAHITAWIVIPLIWFYTYATGWQASAIRSTVMMSVILAGGALRRPSDLLNSLAAAALIILLWDPQQLFQAGFQLSFSVVLCLALCGMALEDIRQFQWRPPPGKAPSWIQRCVSRVPLQRWFDDPLIPEKLRPAPPGWLQASTRWLGRGLATSLAAWLGSIPLVALYFNLFTPVSLLANLVVVPLSSAALAANMASLTVGAFAPGLAELFNNAAWLFMGAMTRFSQWSATWPGAWAYVSTPGWAFLGFYYTALLVTMTGCWKLPRWRGWAAAVVTALAVTWGVQSHANNRATKLTILPLSGGDAICLDMPGKAQDGLIDCGDDKSAHFIVKPFLRSQGMNELAFLALTHGDIRHVGGAEFIQQQFQVRKVALSPVTFRSPAYRELHASATTNSHSKGTSNSLPGRSSSCQYQQFQRGGQLGSWAVLHPEAADHFPLADDNALVLHSTIHGNRLLLLSDLGKPGQNVLLARHPHLRADIVVSGIPTKSEFLADALLDTLHPSVIIVADSLFPATARASSRLRERLGARNARVLFTSDTGGLTIELGENRWKVKNAEGRILDESARACPAKLKAAALTEPRIETPGE